MSNFSEILGRQARRHVGYSDSAGHLSGAPSLTAQRSRIWHPNLITAKGAVLVTVSPLLSWVYIKAPFIGSLSFSLLDLMGVGGKVVTAVVMAIFIAGGISAILAAVVRDHPVGRIFPASAGLTAAGYAAFLLIYGPSALHSANTYSKMAKYVSAHVGPGLWMFAGGGILMVIGAFLPRRRRT